MIEGVIAGTIANLAVDAAVAVHDRRQRRQRRERLSPDLAPLETEFADALGESIEDRAWDLQSDALRTIAKHWDPIVEEIDAYEVAFNDEAAAVEWLVTAILDCDVTDVDLDETEREELEQVVADAYADAIEQFRERVATDDELAHRLQTELNIEHLDRLEEIQTAFERLAESSAYQLYDFPEEREAIVEAVGVDRTVEFVDRAAVPETPTVGRHFVLGPSGSGKSRVIAERLARLPHDAVEHVLVPEEHLLDTSDARALAREPFEGDLLLVWEDLHRVDGGREDGVVRNVLRRLDNALDEQDRQFHALLEAQTGRLEDVFGNLPRDFETEKSLWSTFEPLWLNEWMADRRRVLVDRMAARYDVAIDDDARDALVERTDGLASAPVYVETAFKTAEEQLTVADIDALANEVAAIWERQYDHLRDASEAEWRVLTAMKYLYDMGIQQYSELVYTVFTDHLGAGKETFRTALKSLLDRQWLTVVGDDLVAQETWFRIHDTQLEPVQVSAADDAHDLAELLRDVVGSEAVAPYRVPPAKRALLLFYSSTALLDWRRYELAAKQWEETLRVDPDLLEAHLNCAVTKMKLDQPAEAKGHLVDALQLDPDNAQVHATYAYLLGNELDRPEEAIEHFEKALRIDSENAGAHANYARLLERLGRHDEANVHFEEAIRIDPDCASYHYNYAMFLKRAGQPETAIEHFETALHLGYADQPIAVRNPKKARARTHANYAAVLHNDLERIDAAEEHFERALELNPEHVSAHTNYASLLEETGRPEQATDQYQAALRIDPDHLTSHHNYAMFLKRAGQPETAAEHFEEALRIDPESAPSRRNYAEMLYQQLGQLEAAKEHYEKALELEPESVSALNGYATLLEESGHPEVAAEQFENALELAPENPIIHYNYGAVLLRKLNQPEAAKNQFEAALELGMEDPSLHHNYALLADEGLIELTEAEAHYRRALELAPEDTGIRGDFARFLAEELDRPAEAEEHYETALEHAPDNAAIRVNYAHLLHTKGSDSEAARDLLNAAIQRRIDDGNYEEALEALRYLVPVCRTIGDDKAIIDACDLAADLLDRADSDEEVKLFFDTQRLLTRPTEGDTMDLYRTAINNVVMENWQSAMTLLETTWKRRASHPPDSTEYNAAVAAGPLLAAQLAVFDVQDASQRVNDILPEVTADEIPFPASTLYEQLQHGSAERGPDELRAIVNIKRDEGEPFAALQAHAVGKLLDALQ